MIQILHNLLIFLLIVMGIFSFVVGLIIPLTYAQGIGLPIKGRRLRVLYLSIAVFLITFALQLSLPSYFWTLLFIGLLFLIVLEYAIYVIFHFRR